MNFKNCRYFIQFILEVSYLEKMVLKIIQYFINCTVILEKISGVGNGEYIYFGKSKGCLMKGLILLDLFIVLLQN